MIAMNARTQGTPLSAIALIALSTSALAACGRVPGQFVILQNQSPQDGCSIVADPTTYRGSGVLDLSLVRAGARTAYNVYPLMKNNLAGSAGGGVDTNAIILDSFAVDISVLAGADEKNTPQVSAVLNDPENAKWLHYSVPWSGNVSSGGGLTASRVSAFPVDIAQKLLATQEVGISPSSMTMNLRVRAFGHTTIQDIESDPLNFPISVCAGCLVANVLPCPYTSPPSNAGNACNIAQDTYIDCCSIGGDLICPPLVVEK